MSLNAEWIALIPRCSSSVASAIDGRAVEETPIACKLIATKHIETCCCERLVMGPAVLKDFFTMGMALGGF